MPECSRMGETAISSSPPISTLSPVLQGVLHGQFWVHQLTHASSTHTEADSCPLAALQAWDVHNEVCPSIGRTDPGKGSPWALEAAL